jgi:hypothetical protein
VVRYQFTIWFPACLSMVEMKLLPIYVLRWINSEKQEHRDHLSHTCGVGFLNPWKMSYACNLSVFHGIFFLCELLILPLCCFFFLGSFQKHPNVQGVVFLWCALSARFLTEACAKHHGSIDLRYFFSLHSCPSQHFRLCDSVQVCKQQILLTGTNVGTWYQIKFKDKTYSVE